jgi:hypothetical protein
MNITTTIPDSAIPAWEMRVEQYNAGSGKEPVDIQGFAQVNRDIETAGYVSAYDTAQITKLVPLGEKYNAAPLSVQEQVDALLTPYNP